jgi:hypothetical protein
MRTPITLLTVAFAFTAFAQSPALVTLRDADDNVVNGSTVILYGNPSTVLIEEELTTELNGPVAKIINVRRHELNVVTGSKNYFCWGLCYLPRLAGSTPTWVSGDPLAMAPQQVLSNFKAYYRPEGTSDYACFRYVWYDEANPNDSSWVNICFDTQTFTSVQEVAASASINAYPNPVVGGDVTFTYDAASVNGSVQLVLFNALGERSLVRSLTASNGRTTVPTSGLVPGVWFAALEQNGRMIATQRLVVGR